MNTMKSRRSIPRSPSTGSCTHMYVFALQPSSSPILASTHHPNPHSPPPPPPTPRPPPVSAACPDMLTTDGAPDLHLGHSLPHRHGPRPLQVCPLNSSCMKLTPDRASMCPSKRQAWSSPSSRRGWDIITAGASSPPQYVRWAAAPTKLTPGTRHYGQDHLLGPHNCELMAWFAKLTAANVLRRVPQAAHHGEKCAAMGEARPWAVGDGVPCHRMDA